MADIGTLDKKTIQEYKTYKKNLDHIIDLYNFLGQLYRDRIGSFNLETERKIVKHLADSLERLIVKSSGSAGEINSVQNQMRQVMDTCEKITAQRGYDNQLNSLIQRFTTQFNINLETLIKENKKMTGASAGKSPSPSRSSSEYSVGEKLLIGIPAMLGLTPLAKLAHSMVDIRHAFQGTLSALGESKKKNVPMTASESTVPLPGVTPIATPITAIANKDETKPAEEPIVRRDKNTTEAFKRYGRWYEAERTKGGQIKSMSEIDPVHASLIKFFSTSAYKVRWTRELLEAVQAVGKGGGSARNQKSGDFLSDLGFASLQASAIPVLLAGAAGVAIGLWVDNWIKGHGDFLSGKKGVLTKVSPADMHMNGMVGIGDQMVHGLGRKFFGNKNERQEDRITELVKQGVNPQKAAAITRSELGLPIKAMVTSETQLGTGVASVSSTTPKTATIEKMTSELKQDLMATKAGKVDTTGITERLLKEVPMNTEQADLQRELKEAVDKLYAEIAATHQTIKDGAKGQSAKKPSGYDANNTRNPVLSSLGAGQLDISDS